MDLDEVQRTTQQHSGYEEVWNPGDAHVLDPLARDKNLATSTSAASEGKDEPPTHAPRTLQKSPSIRLLETLYDVLLTLIGALFIVFGALVYTYDGTTYKSGSGSTADKLVQVSQLNPTIFPVVFAALVGGAFKNIATWKVERQASVSFLQQLLGSQSISGAFLTQIKLHAFNIAALLIVLLWSFSPVGSQASSRVIYVDTYYNTTQTNHTTLTAFPTSSLLEDTGSSFNSESWSYITTPWLASITTARIMDSRNQDIWNNLRLPFIEQLETTSNDNDVIPITNSTGITYSSLVGYPITTLPAAGNTSFTLAGSYMNVDCPVLYDVNGITNYTGAKPGGNTDCTWALLSVYNSQIAISQPCKALNISAGGNRDSRRLIYEAPGANNKWVHLECNLSTTYVETAFDCSGSPSTCSPTTVQRSSNPVHSSNWTVLDQSNGKFPTTNLGSLLKNAFPVAGIEGTETLLLTYLRDPDNAIRNTYNNDMTDAQIAAVTKEDYGTRLMQLLNSIFVLGINPGNDGGLLGGFASVNFSDPDVVLADYRNITGSNTVGHELIRCNHIWLGMLFAASLIMCLVGVVGSILHFVTLVPDVLGSVALAMLPNKLRGLEGQSTTQSGTEWVRNLRDMKIQLGDVDPVAEIGRVAFAAPVDGENVRRVKKGRHYY